MSATFDRSEIARLYTEEGMPGPAIAQAIGCSFATVYAALNALGIERHPQTFWPGGSGRPPTDPRKRFMAFVSKQANGCWLWTGKLDKDGYGSFWLGGTNVRATRAALALLAEPIADGLEADHLCFNPPCVNPAHLEGVTQLENLRRRRAIGNRHTKGF